MNGFLQKEINVLDRRKKIMFEPNDFKLDYEAYNENGRANQVFYNHPLIAAFVMSKLFSTIYTVFTQEIVVFSDPYRRCWLRLYLQKAHLLTIAVKKNDFRESFCFYSKVDTVFQGLY